MKTKTFYGEIVGDTAPLGTITEQYSGNTDAKLALITTERTRRFDAVMGGACRASKNGHGCVYVSGHSAVGGIAPRHFNASVGFWK